MAEIKSTLELIMEKTKHLSLSEKEKQQQKAGEAGRKLNGLLQKYVDGILSPDVFSKEMDGLKKTYGLNAETVLPTEIISRLDLKKDNRPLYELLREICKYNTAGMEALERKYQNRLVEAAETRRSKLRQEIAAAYRITGTAVVPNLEKDEALLQALKTIHSEYKRNCLNLKPTL